MNRGSAQTTRLLASLLWLVPVTRTATAQTYATVPFSYRAELVNGTGTSGWPTGADGAFATQTLAGITPSDRGPTQRIASGEFIISTVAGGVPPATPAAATIVPIARPLAVAADVAGNVYFSTFANCVFKLDTAGILHLFAGNSRRGSSGDGGPATAAQFRQPMGVAADGAGNVYIADYYSNRIRRVSPSGIITTVAGTGEQGFSGDDGPATSARLSNPNGLAADTAGNLYIADTGNNRIRRVSPAGIISTVPGTAGQPDQNSIAVDGAGNLYIGDANNNVVRVVAPSGVITTIPAPPQIRSVRAIAVDHAGTLFVSGSDTVFRRIGPAIFTAVAGTGSPGFSGDGGPATSARLWDAIGLAVDTAGNLFIADTFNYRIRRMSAPAPMTYSGIITTVAGDGTGHYSGDGGPATAAQIMPNGVAADGAGNLFIADLHNDRVRRVSPSGIITTFAGTGQPGYSGDGGPATSARLAGAWDVALDPTGNVYIADPNNHCVRRVSPAGIITTAAGICGMFGGFSGDGGPAIAAQFGFPSAVASDAAGNLYISDSDTRVRRVSTSGIVTTFAGNGQEGYSGDGGAATSAQLSHPSGLALDDAGNLYIADSGNNRIRRVSPNGVITTVAGTGASGFSGDGGIATSAQLSGPSGVAVDREGNLYIADRGNHRIRRVPLPPTPFQQAVISTVAGDGADQYSGDGGPAGAAQLASPMRLAIDTAGRVYVSTDNAVRMLTPACAVSASPASLTAPAAGGPLTLTIQAAAGCAWTVLSLPAWITASLTSGSGPATVTLSVDPNTGPARSATITAGGTAVTISQAAGGGGCTYSISPTSQRFSAAGGTGAITISTTAGCAWTAASPVGWITITSGAAGSGSGTVNYTVHPSSSGVSRSSNITVAGFTFTVEQLTGLVAAGTMAQVASGGTWKTSFTLVNNGTAAAMARLTFTADDGTKLTLPLTFPQTGSGPVQAGLIEPVLDPGATLIVESEAPATEPVKQGWAELSTDGAVSGFAVFRQRIGEREQEAVVPLETRAAAGYVLAFDNVGDFVTGVAVANLSSQGGTVSVIINDDWGHEIQTSPLKLAARGHTTFELNKLYPATAGRRGTIEFRPPAGGGISVLGLRFNPKGAFTTVPVMSK